MLFKVNDRVRFKDKAKDSLYGILIIIAIKGTIAILASGDYYSMGSKKCNADLSELIKVE